MQRLSFADVNNDVLNCDKRQNLMQIFTRRNEMLQLSNDLAYKSV
jgi:hypothetical protein